MSKTYDFHPIIASRPVKPFECVLIDYECTEVYWSTCKFLCPLQCIWKMVKMLPEIINDVAVDQVLLECHYLLQAFPSNTWANRPSDTPLRTIKTVIHTLAQLRGAKVMCIIRHTTTHHQNGHTHTGPTQGCQGNVYNQTDLVTRHYAPSKRSFTHWPNSGVPR